MNAFFPFIFLQLMLTGLCIMSLARRRNRYSYLVSFDEFDVSGFWLYVADGWLTRI